MGLKKGNFNVLSINAANIKFLTLLICLVLLVIDLTWSSLETKNVVQYVLASVQEDNKDYEVDSLFVALLANGDASVDYNLVINSSKLSTKISLFGETIQNLTLTDYNETSIRYLPSTESNQITVFSQSSPNIHVTYTTPDLVDKQNRNWTFSFSFPDKFLLKMPSQAHIIDMYPPAFLTPTDEQNLWGFGPGNVKVSYVIGPLGTKEEAQGSIRLVEDAIKYTRSKYENIIFANTSILLENARSNLKQGKYLETVTYATGALKLLRDTSQNFISAKDAISKAESGIQDNRNNNYDTSKAEIKLARAKNLFQAGEYKIAEDAAKKAIMPAEKRADLLSGIDQNVTILVTVGIMVSIASTILLINRNKTKNIGKVKAGKYVVDDIHLETNSKDRSNNNDSESNERQDNKPSITKVQNASPIQFNISDGSLHDSVEIKDYLETVVKEVATARIEEKQQEKSPEQLSPLGEHTENRKSLLDAVRLMKSEKPYLRNDDKELLDFLCEKEGSAFESEIRNKFVLPRTSLWRLIKRLEREDLIEIRK